MCFRSGATQFPPQHTMFRVKGQPEMQTADVVIIGGGIVGASIAWHLTDAGCRNVLIVERESHQGKGSTGKSMGGVRAQFATKPNIQMSLYSIPFYASVRRAAGPARRLPRRRATCSSRRSRRTSITCGRIRRCRSRSGLKQARMVTRDEIVAHRSAACAPTTSSAAASARPTASSIPTA